MLYLQIVPPSIPQSSAALAKRPSPSSLLGGGEADEALGEPARKVVSFLVHQQVVAADLCSYSSDCA